MTRAEKLLEFIEQQGENGTDLRFDGAEWQIRDPFNDETISAASTLEGAIDKLKI